MDLQICSNAQSYISSTLVKKKRRSLRAADLQCSCSHMNPFRISTELDFAVSAGLSPNLLLFLSKRNLGPQSPSKQHQGVSGSICCRLFQHFPVLHILYLLIPHALPPASTHYSFSRHFFNSRGCTALCLGGSRGRTFRISQSTKKSSKIHAL